MNLNPLNYFIKRYHATDLKPRELKNMLNFWLPFIFNRIRIMNITDDFSKMEVCLKYSFFNINPNKSIWGGSIASAIDPFYPILIKQRLLRQNIITDFFSKAVNIKFIEEVKSDISLSFNISDSDIVKAKKSLFENGKYENWHSVEGIDVKGKACIKANIQIFLRKR